MEQKTNRLLNICYYAFYLLACITAVALNAWVKQLSEPVIHPMTKGGMTLQYAVILYTIVSVAGGLYIFKRQMGRISGLPAGDDKIKAYMHWGLIRISLIGLGVTIGVGVFYLLGGYSSMIWCAAISAIGLYFCKPSLQRMEQELQGPGDQNL